MENDPLNNWFNEHEDYRCVADYVALPPSADEIKNEFADASQEVLAKCFEIIEVGGMAITRGTLYVKVRRSGTADRMAEMLALQQCARGMTDDIFFSGMGTLDQQIGSNQKIERYVKAARAQGFNPTPHHVYFPNLARFAGDREAWVSRADGRGYIKKLCEKRGWACEGGINVKHRQPESDPLDPKNCVAMAPDVLRSNMRNMIKQDPSLATKKPSELRQMVLDKHGPSV